MKEIKVKEMYEKLKSSKSKKRKIDLIREYKPILTIVNWRMTVIDAEDAHYKNLKLERKCENKKKENAKFCFCAKVPRR